MARKTSKGRNAPKRVEKVDRPSSGVSLPERDPSGTTRMTWAQLKWLYDNRRPFDEPWDSSQAPKGYAAGGIVGMANSGLDAVQTGLDSLGLDPSKFDMGYTPEQPKLRSYDEAYHPGLRGIIERVGPFVSRAFEGGDYQSPLGRTLARLAHAAGDYLDDSVVSRTKDIQEGNLAERQRVEGVNSARRQQVAGNQTQYRKLLNERLPTPRQVLERKAQEKADETATVETARVNARTKAYQDQGLNPPGTPHKATPRKGPAPKVPPSPFKTSFKLFGDADRIALKQLTDELGTMRKDPFKSAAFEPVKRDKRGQPMGERPDVTAARTRINEINRQVQQAHKSALLYHLNSVQADAAADPAGATRRLNEIRHAAEELNLAGDKDIDSAGRSAGAAIRAAGTKAP